MTEIDKANVPGAKSAVTVVAAASATVQSALPVQPSDQRTNLIPGPAVATSPTGWFASQSDSHDAVHEMPGTSLAPLAGAKDR